jgi:hypothetical protein
MSMSLLRYVLLPAVVFVPLMILSYQRGQDLGQVGLLLVSLTVLLFLILAWSGRARAEYRQGLMLKAAFSLSVVLFFLALLFQLVRGPLGLLFLSEQPPAEISEKKGG